MPSGTSATLATWLLPPDDIRPVLIGAYAAVAKGDPYGVEQRAINAELEREPDDARTDRALFELEKADYIEGTIGPTSGM